MIGRKTSVKELSMLQKLETIAIGPIDKFELEHRCYNGVCLAAGLGCLLGVVNNVLLSLPLMATLVTALVGIIYLWLYFDSRRRESYRPYIWVYILNGAILLAITWFLNGGISGPDLVISMVALVALSAVMKTDRFLVVFYLFIPIMSLLFLTEYYFPSAVIGYSTPKQRFIDVYLSLIVATTVIYAILITILQSYKSEKERLDAANLLLSEKMELLNESNANLQKATGEIKTLSGMLPICAACKKIRDDQGYWNQIESFISEYSDAAFSHSICPACARKLYPELEQDPE